MCIIDYKTKDHVPHLILLNTKIYPMNEILIHSFPIIVDQFMGN
jgi:hypothetical protein